MYDEAYKQRYIDSYSFIPMRLAKTASALNLTCSEKGHFPHKFNLKQNENYIGPYPAKSFYGYDTMNDKDRKQFDEWYNTVSGGVFDFKKELYVYGRNDVVLLQNQATECVHDNEDRSITGTWVSIELLKAVEKGYVLDMVS
ncbi:hypothetical protein NFI96_027631 [Prochilodus magdalenae]|nr:hypothetical protein NFI96_027631 [Prochilodus magdalenae]